MSDRDRMSAHELSALRRDYRALKAPPFLATRIRAGVDERSTRRARRRPLFAAVAIAAGVLAILPFINWQAATQQPSIQPMASLSLGLTTVKLPPSPSLAKLRSVSPPPLPPRPVTPNPDRSGKPDDVQTHNPWQQENTHEVT
mgnify:CR=1 FL=1